MAYFHTNVLDNQIKALPTVSTASGSVATFDTDMTENLIECVCDIMYSQASGTPTPSSPIPIQVFDSLTLYHNDINIWDEQWENGQYDGTTGQKINTSLANTSIRCKNYIPCIPDTNYFVLVPYSSVVTGFCAVLFYDSSKTFISKTNVKSNGYNAVVTTPNNAHYITFFVSSLYGTAYNNDISINYPSTDTQYHAFNGAYIPFGQTVAKGKLNVTTGVLEIEWSGIDLYTLTDWAYIANYNCFSATVPNIKQPTSGAERLTGISSSNYKISDTYQLANMPNESCLRYTNKVYIKDTRYTDATSFKTALQNENAQLIYERDNITNVQLSSNQVQALLNENNIWCDTNGNTSVKYLLSVGKKIS